MPSEILIGPGLVATPERVLPHAGVHIAHGRIAAVGDYDTLGARLQASVTRLATPGQLILPGFINAHTHLYSSLARGLSLPGSPPASFPQILEQLWWRLDRALDAGDVETSALVGLVECARCGVTTIIDHHTSPCACSGSLERIRGAVEAVGLRAALCYEVSDRNGPADARAGMDENLRFIRDLARRPSDRIAALFGLHALFTLSEETLATCVAAARELGVGLHLHLAEGTIDVETALSQYGERPVARLLRHGALGARTIAAHAVHVDASEIATLAETRAFVVHNPASNMNNAVGVAPILAMLARGVRVGLGTDGLGADMIASARTAALLQRHANGDPRAGWLEAPQLLWSGNAEMASQLFGFGIGRLEPGAAGDLAVLDYDPATPLTSANLAAHLLLGIDARHVRTVIVGGEIIVQDRRLLTMDEAAVRAQARERARSLWARL
jgi:putative selenium metabolism protein SsnA